jgi:hypothetical protein
MAAQLILMNGPARHQLLACARLACDEHRRRRVGDLLDHGVELANRGRVAHQTEAPVHGGIHGPGIATRERVREHRFGDDLVNLLLVKRLFQVVKGAQLDRLDRVFH